MTKIETINIVRKCNDCDSTFIVWGDAEDMNHFCGKHYTKEVERS